MIVGKQNWICSYSYVVDQTWDYHHYKSLGHQRLHHLWIFQLMLTRVSTAEERKRQASLRRQLEDRKKELVDDKAKNTDQHICWSLQTAWTITHLSNSEQENMALLDDKGRLHQRLQQMRYTRQEIKRSNFYKRLERKEQRLKTLEATIQAHARGNCEKTARTLRRRVKLQTKASHHMRQLHSLQQGQRDHEITRHELAVNDLLVLANVPRPVINTRKDNSDELQMM